MFIYSDVYEVKKMQEPENSDGGCCFLHVAWSIALIRTECGVSKVRTPLISDPSLAKVSLFIQAHGFSGLIMTLQL